MTVKLKGTREVLKALETVQDGVLDDLAGALIDIGHRIEGDAKESMRGFDKAPSLPGEPPAVQTGRLRASITSQLAISGKTMMVKVGPQKGKKPDQDGYAFFLEFGTSRIYKRPYLRPAFDKNRAWAKRKLERAVGKATL